MEMNLVRPKVDIQRLADEAATHCLESLEQMTFWQESNAEEREQIVIGVRDSARMCSDMFRIIRRRKLMPTGTAAVMVTNIAIELAARMGEPFLLNEPQHLPN